MRTNLPSLLLCALLSIAAISCSDDCYDQALADSMATVDCTADCPGVTACNGDTYCNECLANQAGYAVE
jgi:hypothetical protein